MIGDTAVDSALDDLRGYCRPGTCSCLHQTARARLFVTKLAAAFAANAKAIEWDDSEVEAEYRRLVAAHPDAPACPEFEPALAMAAPPPPVGPLPVPEPAPAPPPVVVPPPLPAPNGTPGTPSDPRW